MKLKNALPYFAGPARILLTVLIVLIAVSLLQTITMEVVRMFAYAKRTAATKSETELTQEEKRIERIRRSSKNYLHDGTIHLVYEPRPQRGRMTEPRIGQIYDTNDNLLWEGPSDQRPYEYFSWAKGLRNYIEAFALRQLRNTQMLTPVFSRNIEVPVGSINNTEQIWRYHPGAKYFVGYDSSGERIGYIGAAGFSDSRSKTKPFGEFRLFTAWCPQDSSSPTLLWQTNRRIYQIDFGKQHVEPIFESTDSDIETINLHAWRDLKPGTKNYIDSEKYRPLLLCITKDGKRHLILRNPDRQLTFTIPEDWQGWLMDHCRFTATRQGIFLLRNWTEWRAGPDYFQDKELFDQWRRDYENQAKKHRVELYKMNDGGGLEMLNHYDWTVPAPGRSKRVEHLAASRRFVTHFSPPLYNVIFRVLDTKLWSRIFQPENRGDFFWGMLRVPLELQPLSTLINRLISALMMGFVFWHGWPRRTSIARFVFWLVFVGAFNLTGLLTYLALNHTAIITCPACGGRRGLARVDCVQCRAQLPAPKRGKLDLIFRQDSKRTDSG